MASLYSALFIYVCISLLLPSHVAKYYATTVYASRENSKRTDFITDGDDKEEDRDEEGAGDEGGAEPEASTTPWRPRVLRPRMKAWKGKGKDVLGG